MNNKNLTPLNKRTKEQRQAIAKAGGIASGESRKEKAKVKEIVKSFMNSKPSKEQEQELINAGFCKDEISNNAYMLYSMIQKAKAGDTQAFRLLLELQGEDLKTTQFNETMQVKKQELSIKQQELALKKQAQDYKLDIIEGGSLSDKVVFVEVHKGASKQDIETTLNNMGLNINSDNVVIDEGN